jgi:F-type H+-transporting ATPase subunit b
MIDWFTVGAQIINFLVLVWLMGRFLYKPVLHVIDEREKRIAAELANAENKKSEAQKESSEFRRKNEEFEAQRSVLWNKVTDEANAERQRRLDDAMKAADILSLKRQEMLKNEEHSLLEEIRHRTQQEVFAISRKALLDLASASLEERLSNVFIRRLRELDDGARAGLAGAIKTMSEPAIVRSVFDLPAQQRAEIQSTFNEMFSAKIDLRFETAPDLISGIELSLNGEKVEWSIADYLTSLEKSVDEILKEKGKPEAKSETGSLEPGT